jgi:predicted metal-dependent HD superfamily phosphohydrolase
MDAVWPIGQHGAVVHPAAPGPGAPLRELRARWAGLAADLGLHGGGEDVRDELLAAYAEPHRRYHSTTHLLAVLRTLDDLHHPGPAPAASRAALWFHDAVYDPTAAGNEAASAGLARERLGALGLDAELAERVGALVEATAEHTPPPGLAGVEEVLDADLAVLGADRASYRAYAAAVREEYGHLSDDAFRTGRAAVLRTFAARGRLYHSAAGAARYEATARANLAWELRELGAPTPGAASAG